MFEKSGDDIFSELPGIFVIFITEDDVIGKGNTMHKVLLLKVFLIIETVIFVIIHFVFAFLSHVNYIYWHEGIAGIIGLTIMDYLLCYYAIYIVIQLWDAMHKKKSVRRMFLKWLFLCFESFLCYWYTNAVYIVFLWVFFVLVAIILYCLWRKCISQQIFADIDTKIYERYSSRTRGVGIAILCICLNLIYINIPKKAAYYLNLYDQPNYGITEYICDGNIEAVEGTEIHLRHTFLLGGMITCSGKLFRSLATESSNATRRTATVTFKSVLGYQELFDSSDYYDYEEITYPLDTKGRFPGWISLQYTLQIYAFSCANILVSMIWIFILIVSREKG